MITEAIMWVVGQFVEFVASLLPDLPDPARSIGAADSAWGQLIGYMAGVAGWFPFSVAITCVAVVAAIAAVAGGIKFTRIVASFLTGGGGSAA